MSSVSTTISVVPDWSSTWTTGSHATWELDTKTFPIEIVAVTGADGFFRIPVVLKLDKREGGGVSASGFNIDVTDISVFVEDVFYFLLTHIVWQVADVDCLV